MDVMLVIAWYAAGIIGAVMLWNTERRCYNLSLCPTPRALLLGIIGALLGPALLFVGVVGVLVDIGFSINDKLRGTWFTRPICDRDAVND